MDKDVTTSVWPRKRRSTFSSAASVAAHLSSWMMQQTQTHRIWLLSRNIKQKAGDVVRNKIRFSLLCLMIRFQSVRVNSPCSTPEICGTDMHNWKRSAKSCPCSQSGKIFGWTGPERKTKNKQTCKPGSCERYSFVSSFWTEQFNQKIKSCACAIRYVTYVSAGNCWVLSITRRQFHWLTFEISIVLLQACQSWSISISEGSSSNFLPFSSVKMVRRLHSRLRCKAMDPNTQGFSTFRARKAVLRASPALAFLVTFRLGKFRVETWHCRRNFVPKRMNRICTFEESHKLEKRLNKVKQLRSFVRRCKFWLPTCFHVCILFFGVGTLSWVWRASCAQIYGVKEMLFLTFFEIAEQTRQRKLQKCTGVFQQWHLFERKTSKKVRRHQN